jgi:8-oxo-dGTP pyrophosphatase MutT (NUDIX family)
VGAKREAQEEMGLQPSSVQVGRLTGCGLLWLFGMGC